MLDQMIQCNASKFIIICKILVDHFMTYFLRVGKGYHKSIYIYILLFVDLLFDHKFFFQKNVP